MKVAASENSAIRRAQTASREVCSSVNERRRIVLKISNPAVGSIWQPF
jgi:hypothetical protein